MESTRLVYMKNELRAWNTVTPENERRAGRFSVVDHREKRTDAHLTPLFRSASDRRRCRSPRTDGQPRKCAPFIVIIHRCVGVISRLARGAGHGCVAVEVWYILHPYTEHGKKGRAIQLQLSKVTKPTAITYN